MRMLITGVHGFIGRHLFDYLAAQRPDWEITGWDLPAMDITKPMRSTEPARFDAVVHLAAMASPVLCDRDPGTAFQVNVQGTHNVLKMAVAAGAKRFIFASTAHVYGVSPKYLPTDERAPLAPFDTYTTTKIIGEQLCQLFWDNYGLSYAAIRLFNCYGPGQQPGYFVPDQIQQAEKGPFELRGAGITKDFVYIDDVVRAYVLALESSFLGPINIGTGVETDLASIAGMIAKAFKTELICVPAAKPTRMQADIRRAETVLGWHPTVSIEEGLNRVIEVAMRTIPKVTQ